MFFGTWGLDSPLRHQLLSPDLHFGEAVPVVVAVAVAHVADVAGLGRQEIEPLKLERVAAASPTQILAPVGVVLRDLDVEARRSLVAVASARIEMGDPTFPKVPMIGRSS